MRQLKDNSYGGGRFSYLKEKEWECLTEYFADDIKHRPHLGGNYVDINFLLELYSKSNYPELFSTFRKSVKNVFQNMEKTNLSDISNVNLVSYNYLNTKKFIELEFIRLRGYTK